VVPHRDRRTLAPQADGRTSSCDDWREIAALYALLEGFRPTPAVRVNRAFALGKANGAAAGLALLANSDIDARAYPYVHLVRGSLLDDVGEREAAAAELEQAVRRARNDHERRQIKERMSRVLRRGDEE
jgi:RNA polymerase sigma-70 factor (ECF subfamily)